MSVSQCHHADIVVYMLRTQITVDRPIQNTVEQNKIEYSFNFSKLAHRIGMSMCSKAQVIGETPQIIVNAQSIQGVIVVLQVGMGDQKKGKILLFQPGAHLGSSLKLVRFWKFKKSLV